MTSINNDHVDTITAQATPPGRGGIAVVRVSGPRVKFIIQALLGKEITPRHAVYLPFLDADTQILDEGLAIYFPNPHSFTGEDVLELQGHGGPVVVDLILQRLVQLGARLARPGEFSERAFLNGKIDLTQAEAIADLIDASSQQAARSALRSLQGEFSTAIHVLNEKIIYLRMYVEAAIDFSDEEIDFLADDKIIGQLRTIMADLSEIQAKAKQGSFLREGITVVISGEPNVGKSSLLNYLAGKDIAIVTDIPGTTRDVLRTEIIIDGLPLHIIDTAGLRDSTDVVELEGIRRARREMEQADIIISVTDASEIDRPVLNNTHTCPVICLRNKIDLTAEQPSVVQCDNYVVVSVSVKNSLGMDLLKEQIKSLVGFHSTTEGTYLARRRHLDALENAASYLRACQQQLMETRAGELAAEDLRLAHRALSEITGEFTSDDLLGRIFSSFCVGK